MKCKSCKAEIDPKWKSAIEKNVCPFCGEEVIDSVLQDIFSELRELIDVSLADQFKDQVLEWFKSNYNLILISNIKESLSDEDKKHFIDIGYNNAKTEFKNSVFNKKISKLDEESPEKGVLLERASEERTSEYMKRAGVLKDGDESISDKTQRLKSERKDLRSKAKSMVELIQKESEDDSDFQEPLENVKLYPDDVLDEEQNEEDFDDEIPSHVLAMAAAGSSNSKEMHNAKDLQALNRMKSKRRSKFTSATGGFRRS